VDNKVYGGGVNFGGANTYNPTDQKELVEVKVGNERISHVICSYSHALIYTAKRELYSTAPNLSTTKKLKFFIQEPFKMLVSDISEHDVVVSESDKLYMRTDPRGEFDETIITPPLEMNHTIVLLATGYSHTVVITGPRKKKHSRLHANWKFDDIDFFF
jgi:hypothetical protein